MKYIFYLCRMKNIVFFATVMVQPYVTDRAEGVKKKNTNNLENKRVTHNKI